jgi:hypothetical protein
VKSAPKPPIEEEGTRVSYLAPRSVFEMPTANQLAALKEVVYSKFPSLRPKFDGRWASEDEAEFEKGYAAAFLALGYLERREQVDHKKALSYWAQLAEDACRALGRSASIPGSALMVAAVASGNVPYVLADVANGVVPVLGLYFGSNMGKLPGNEWRNVLATGRVLAPTVSPVSRNYATPPFRVVDVA